MRLRTAKYIVALSMTGGCNPRNPPLDPPLKLPWMKTPSSVLTCLRGVNLTSKLGNCYAADAHAYQSITQYMLNRYVTCTFHTLNATACLVRTPSCHHQPERQLQASVYINKHMHILIDMLYLNVSSKMYCMTSTPYTTVIVISNHGRCPYFTRQSEVSTEIYNLLH